MASWYYFQNNTETGPVSDAALKVLIQNGTIVKTTLVRTDKMSEFVSAEKIRGIQFPTLENAPPRPSTGVPETAPPLQFIVRPTIIAYLFRILFVLAFLVAAIVFVLIDPVYIGFSIAAMLFFTAFGWVLLVELLTKYIVQSNRLQVKRGILIKSTLNVEFTKIRDTETSQNLLDRIIHTGNLILISSDSARPACVIKGITMENVTRIENVIKSAYGK